MPGPGSPAGPVSYGGGVSRVDPRIEVVLREMMMRQMVAPNRGTLGSVDAMPYPRTLEEVLRDMRPLQLPSGMRGGVRG